MSLIQWHEALAKSILETHQPFGNMVKQDAGFSSDERITVYSNNYRQGLINALETSFPNCMKHVGDQYFAQLAGHYVAEYPPLIADLNQYGESFPDYIQRLQTLRPELSAMQYLSDFATLDWLLYQIYFAADRTTWPADQFQALSAEQQAQCRLSLSPDIQLLSSKWPLYDLWRLNRNEIESVDMDEQRQSDFLVIYREGYQPFIDKINETEFALFRDIQDSMPIIKLTQQHPVAMNQLVNWIQRGWICGFLSDDSE